MFPRSTLYMTRFSHAIAALCAGTLTAFSATAEPSAQLPESIVNFLDLNCYECHNDTEKKGGLDMESLRFDPTDHASMGMWALLHDRVRDGEMPPKDELQPEVQERADFLHVFEASLHEASERQQQSKGRVRSRRLNRIEFENTLHDLLGIDIPLKVYMPEDTEQEGFDNIADAQQISYHLLQTYLEAADAALDESFQRALKPERFETRVYDIDEISKGRNRRGNTRDPFTIDNAAVSYPTTLSYHGRMPNTRRLESGWYRVRLRARAVNAPEGHGVWTSVRSGYCYAVKPLMYWIGSFEARDEPEEHEFEAWIEEDHMLEVRPSDRSLRRISGRTITGGTAPDEQAPGVAIEYLDITPINRGLETKDLRERLFGSLPLRKGELVSANPRRDLRQLIAAFAERAFRRPANAAEIESYIEFANRVYRDEQSLLEGLKAGYRAILSSPRFLYFRETPGQLDPYSIASRLSYFLWNRMPDGPLLAAASDGSLNRPAVIRKQVERMLADDRSAAFIENFAAQWLDLKDIDFTSPDEKLYPEFDDTLKHAMLGETHSFLRKLLDENLSVVNVIDSDFAMLNERIARHYGIDGVSGSEYRPVPIDAESRRGGLITHASVLKVSANGTTTSPVIRGVWLLERVLGEHISPPPDDVPAIEPDIRGASSIREQLDKHRSTASCNACHVKIDPPGFALENYDVIGGWRDRYRAINYNGRLDKGPTVDPSYHAADGPSFDNVDGFKRMILAKPDQIARNLLEKTLVYATGASIEFADRREIDALVADLAHDQYGFRSIIHAAVQSSIFLEK